MKIYIKKSPNAAFEVLETPDRELGRGGQAYVYKILTKGYEDYCFKKYIKEDTARNSYSRIVYMIANPPQNFIGSNNFRICWPTALAYDSQKNFIGYIMPLAFPNSRDLKILEVYNPKPISQQAKYKKYPDWFDKFELDSKAGLKNRMKMLCNWAIAIYSLHETNKYVIVDLKPENVMATSSGKISIVDTDSFQISENGRLLFPGAAYTPAYFPKEGKDIHKSQSPFPISCDCFAAAVCFYKILTGVHPYGGTIKKSPYDTVETDEEAISKELFAYGDKKNYLGFNQSFNLHKNFDNLSLTIQKLFIRAFGSNPNARPTLEEWGKALRESIMTDSSVLRSVVKPPVTNTLPIGISSVKFADLDSNFKIIRNYGSKLYTDMQYLTPQITYQVLNTGAPIEVWYKVFSPNGHLRGGKNAKPGFTWKGTVRRDSKTVNTVDLGGFGGDFTETGTWRAEFYVDDRCIYRTTFEVYAKVPSSSSSSYSSSSSSSSSYSPSYSSYGGYSSRSAWDKFKDKIESIGEWFDDDAYDKISGTLCVIAMIVYVIAIISAWMSDGFFSALITGVVGFFILGICWYAIAVISKIVQVVLGLVFRNVWIFLIVLSLLLFSFVKIPLQFMFDGNDDTDYAQTEVVKPVAAPTTIYYCTSDNGLRVRATASKDAVRLGSVKYGEAVEVVKFEGDYARIKYKHSKGDEAWVTGKYLSKTRP